MQIISFLSQKGGVGKTTLAFNFAIGKAMAKKRVLAIDLDTQHSLTDCFDCAAQLSFFDVLQQKLPMNQAILKQVKPNLDLLGSQPNINVLDDYLQQLPLAKEKQLTQQLAQVANDYDVVVVDLPPTFKMTTINAIVASDKLVIPTKADFINYQTLIQTYDNLAELKRMDNTLKFQIAGVVVNMFEKVSKDDQQFLKLMQEQYPVLSIVNKSVKVKRLIGEHLGLLEKDNYLTRCQPREAMGKIIKGV